jgi:Tfp pilus assembly protein PilF
MHAQLVVTATGIPTCHAVHIFPKRIHCAHTHIFLTQAEAAYQRATSLDPSNPLAWQGSAELHTATGMKAVHLCRLFSV